MAKQKNYHRLMTIAERDQLVDPARKLMVTAYYYGMVRHLSKTLQQDEALPEAQKKEAFRIATEIVDHYIALYSSPERVYHTPQHALVQTLPFRDNDIYTLCQTIDRTLPEFNSYQHADDLLKSLTIQKEKNGLWELKLSSSMINRDMLDEFTQYLRTQLRDDCLYYIPNYKNESGERSHQTEMLAEIKESNPPLSLDDIIDEANDKITVKELMAVVAFPDGQGSYDKSKSFEGYKVGLDEWMSAVYAVEKENALRTSRGFPPLSAQETLQTCITLAASIHFQSQGYFERMAENLRLFFSKGRGKMLRNELGISPKNINTLINQMVFSGARFTQIEMNTFIDVEERFYDAGRANSAEALGLRLNTDDLVERFQIEKNAFLMHASVQEALNIGIVIENSGFIRRQSDADRMRVSFDPLPMKGGVKKETFEIKKTDIDAYRQRYKKISTIALEWHRFDMAKQIEKIAKAVEEPIHTTMTLPDTLSLYAKDTDITRSMQKFSNEIFTSTFWMKYKGILQLQSIKTLDAFKEEKTKVDANQKVVSKLAQTPRLLAMMRANGMLSSTSMQRVIDVMNEQPKKGPSRFAGDIIIDLGLMNEQTGESFTRDDVKTALREHALKKAESAMSDMQTVCAGKKLQVPLWLTPQWGNHGVNQPTSAVSKEDGISAAANMAQNLVLLANTSPSIASKAQLLVVDLVNLARGFTHGDSLRVPIAKKGHAWLEHAQKEYMNIVKDSGIKLSDNAGRSVDLNAYCDMRFKEMSKALDLTLEQHTHTAHHVSQRA